LVFGQQWVPSTAHDQVVAKGRKLAAQGDFAGALEAFTAFYSKRTLMGRIIRRRNATVVFDLIKLAEVHEPAGLALSNLAGEIETEIVAQTAGDEDISDWCTLVRHLEKFDHAWELYNKLLKNPSEAAAAAKLANVVYARLIGEKRYEEALPTARENARWAIDEVAPEVTVAGEQAQLFTYWLPSAYEAYEVLLACDENKLCAELETWALKITPRERVLEGLLAAAERADKAEAVQKLKQSKN